MPTRRVLGFGKTMYINDIMTTAYGQVSTFV